MSYAYLLRNVSLFAQLNEDELELLAAEFILQHFRRGQVLFQQGSATNCLYIVKSGSVQVTASAKITPSPTPTSSVRAVLWRVLLAGRPAALWGGGGP